MKNLSFAAVTLITLAGLAFGARVEQDDPSVALNGAWNSQVDSNASAGSYVVSGTAGNTVNYSFTGTSVVLWRELDPSGGSATVMIDNKPWGSISFNFPQRAYQVPAVIDQLSPGSHTMLLTVASTNPFSTNTGTNVYIDAFEAPSTFAPTAAQQAALVRLNQYRSAAGLPAASLSTALNLASQAHADYNGLNNNGPSNPGVGLDAHQEVQGNAGFVGVQFSDRDQYFGYPQPASEDAAAQTDPAGAIDGWLSTVYHRGPMMSYFLTDIGFGDNTSGGGTVLDFGTQHSGTLSARQIVTYPGNKQTNIPLLFTGENPNPLPNLNGPFGFPISVHIQQPSNANSANSTTPITYTLTDQTGKSIGVTPVDRNTDPNPGFRGADDYFMIPSNPLTPSTTYTATVSGNDSTGSPFNVSWSFTTVPGSSIINISGSLQGYNYVVQWNTAGPVTSSQINYGLTTAYGTSQVVTPSSDGTFVVSLPNLPGGTYHYQISATDAQGNTQTSPDATFVIPNIAAATIQFKGAFPFTSTDVYVAWQTFGPVASTQLVYGLTTSYGSTEPSRADTGGANSFYAQPGNLTPGATYHFQIMATDAQGNVQTTPDMTFTMPM